MTRRALPRRIMDGLLYGCGDACIGINPATDSVATVKALLHMLDGLIREYQIPTQSCVLSHITTTLRAIEEGAPVDLAFQSIAGTEAANRSFGIDLKLLRRSVSGHAFAETRHAWEKRDVFRDRTGLVPERQCASRR